MTRIRGGEKWMAAGDGSWLSGLSSTGNGSDRILACRILGSDCDINAARNAGPYNALLRLFAGGNGIGGGGADTDGVCEQTDETVLYLYTEMYQHGTCRGSYFEFHLVVRIYR